MFSEVCSSESFCETKAIQFVPGVHRLLFQICKVPFHNPPPPPHPPTHTFSFPWYTHTYLQYIYIYSTSFFFIAIAAGLRPEAHATEMICHEEAFEFQITFRVTIQSQDILFRAEKMAMQMQRTGEARQINEAAAAAAAALAVLEEEAQDDPIDVEAPPTEDDE